MNPMYKNLCVFLIAFSLLFISRSAVEASYGRSDATANWSPPEELSHTSSYSKRPIAVSDIAGNVHTFWAENYGDDQHNEGTSDSIYYSVWDGQGWSIPLDVIATEEIDQAHLQALDTLVDNEGVLHLLWAKTSTRYGDALYWTSVHVSQVAHIHAWNTTVVDVGVCNGADVLLDSEGTLHLVYAVNAEEIVYRDSPDNGLTWSTPKTVYIVNDKSFGVDLPKIAVALPNTLHIVWSEASAEDRWNPSGVLYARSENSGDAWSEAIRFSGPGRHGQPNIIIDGEGRIHVLWLRYVGAVDGRYYTWSADGGDSWHDPVVMAFGSGFTSPPSLALDSEGNAHFLNAAEIYEGIIPIYHSVWQDNAWGTPQPIPDSNGEAAYLVIRGGNDLWALWHNAGDVFFSHAAIEADALLFEPVPALLDPDFGSPPSEITATQTVTSQVPNNTEIHLAGGTLESHQLAGDTNTSGTDALRVLLLPTMLCLVLLIGVALPHARR